MRRTAMRALALILLILPAACKLAASPTADTQATINAAVVATDTAQAGVQATVDAAVVATHTAQAAAQATETATATTAATTSGAQPGAQATIDAAVQATLTATAAQATPTPEVEYVTLTEEELAAMIDDAVTEAVVVTEACTEATAQATSDGAMTSEEVVMIEVQVAGAEEAIAYAEELLAAYYGLYGELAIETLALLQAIESDLAALAESTAAIANALEDATTALEQGLALAEETLVQLESAAQIAAEKAASIQGQNAAWKQALQAELETRAAVVLSVTPGAIATDRLGAVQSAFEYLDAVREALTDDKLTAEELLKIAQHGAKASASLSAHGGPQLKQLSGSINEISTMLARGQVPQAAANLGTLESALGSRPSKPSR